MSQLLKIGFFLSITFSFIFASWYVLHGDINFSSDIARDLTLMHEIDQKKIVLIGARSDGNLYQGPLWLYVNYPLYTISHGNPVGVGISWVLLWFIFTVLCFLISKDIFDSNVAMVFTSWSSLEFAFMAKGLTNPHGAMILTLPALYFFIKYLHKYRLTNLLLFYLILGILTQFEIGMGIPFILLSLPPVIYFSFKNHTKGTSINKLTSMRGNRIIPLAVKLIGCDINLL